MTAPICRNCNYFDAHGGANSGNCTNINSLKYDEPVGVLDTCDVCDLSETPALPKPLQPVAKRSGRRLDLDDATMPEDRALLELGYPEMLRRVQDAERASAKLEADMKRRVADEVVRVTRELQREAETAIETSEARAAQVEQLEKQLRKSEVQIRSEQDNAEHLWLLANRAMDLARVYGASEQDIDHIKYHDIFDIPLRDLA